MSQVRDLIPGDCVTIQTGDSATFLCQTRHPIWPHLQLVIWWVDDMEGKEPFWSFDALDERQEIGQIREATPADRSQQLARILLKK
jgi:hypothetical protein